MDELMMMQVPELDDAQFYTDVMQLGVDETEVQHDRELLSKAHGLGIVATLPTISQTHRLASSSAMSDSTESTSREQAFSTVSDGSTMTYSTPHSSIYGAPITTILSCDNNNNNTTNVNINNDAHKFRRKSINFSPYDKYLLQVHLVSGESSSPSRHSFSTIGSSGQSIFGVSTRKSVSGVRSGFRDRLRLRKKSARICETPLSCSKCNAPLSKAKALQSLPCGHANCTHCLRDLTLQAINDEATMPPSCCAEPVPSDTLQKVLDIDVQESFLKAVLQYSTPSKSRVFCCNPVCGEFIPPLKRIDTNMPSMVTCLKCQTKVCPSCKRGAHALGTHCPEDWELLDALKIGGHGSWRRCYQCCKLVELADAIGPVTCACDAKFCYACGGVWDVVTGCPNVCKGEEELARRREEEQRRTAEAEASEALEEEEAIKRSTQNSEVQSLLESQRREMQRMRHFREAAVRSLETRQSAQEMALAGKHVQDRDELAEKHAKDTSLLEDRQIDEELDLRSTLDQEARSIHIRIKHMEAYCHGLAKNPSTSGDNTSLPPRVVTDQHLRNLDHQYNLRDDVERQHQAKINMMRDRQSKRMEELIQKHEAQLDALTKRNQKAYAALGDSFARERETFDSVFEARQSRFTARWALAIEVQCKQLEERDGLRYSVVAPPSWSEPAVMEPLAPKQ
ncbi:hypothetical protein E4U21_000151 [Claviceps maximensis]|nr:hypothetical protein E4U21_000151 [Claviceps maximensis]